MTLNLSIDQEIRRIFPMSKFIRTLCMATCAFTLGSLVAEESQEALSSQVVATIELETGPAATELSLETAANTAAPAAVETPIAKPTAAVREFSPFTGQVRARKVRMRLRPELDGQVLQELNKGDLLSVVGEHGQFWAVSPVNDRKVFVFRGFVFDNKIEGNRVNIRLEPSVDAPVIGHLNSGDEVQGSISSVNNKWFEITPPNSVVFYVAKEYVDNVGGPNMKKEHDARLSQVEELLDTASLLAKAEMRKQFSDINLDKASHNFQSVISNFSDFPEFVEQAKNELSSLQEEYMQKKIAYLEAKAATVEEASTSAAAEVAVELSPTEKMKMWEPLEDSLYLTWTRVNEEKAMQDYYDEQKANAVVLTGFIEPYTTPVKSKPGDFVIKDGDLPVAYVYSTQVNLQDFVGKKVAVIASARPNNNFAFPAYFVHEVE